MYVIGAAATGAAWTTPMTARPPGPVTSCAFFLPFLISSPTTENSTNSPICKFLLLSRPGATNSALWCTKISSPLQGPSVVSMNPKHFCRSNHFTVPRLRPSSSGAEVCGTIAAGGAAATGTAGAWTAASPGPWNVAAFVPVRLPPPTATTCSVRGLPSRPMVMVSQTGVPGSRPVVPATNLIEATCIKESSDCARVTKPKPLASSNHLISAASQPSGGGVTAAVATTAGTAACASGAAAGGGGGTTAGDAVSAAGASADALGSSVFCLFAASSSSCVTSSRARFWVGSSAMFTKLCRPQ